MSYIVTPEILKQWMVEGDVVIVDVRADLFDSAHGIEAYRRNHIPGAVFLDLEKDLSGPVQEHGGNHPLPDLNHFADRLGSVGISAEHRVVVYDDRANMFAPRAWFLLKYIGLEKVYVLEGGYEAWLEEGYPVNAEIPDVVAMEFVPKVKEELIVSMEEVKHRPSSTLLIDSRSKARYLGDEEPLYHRAGHIPGAVNYFWEDVFTEKGEWRSPEQLERHFALLNKSDSIIVSCGSGVSACANLLALSELGYKDVKLYPGSFSDWISYEENDIHTKEDLD